MNYKIIQFYLLECPVRTFDRVKKEEFSITNEQPHPKYNYVFRKVSKKGRTFKDRGLDGARLNTLRAAMKKIAKVKLDSVKTISEKPNGEFIIYINNGHVSVTEGYFYFIRNAFAHGEFEVRNNTYYLENHKNQELKGVGVLKETTLLKWMDLVEMTPEQLKNVGK